MKFNLFISLEMFKKVLSSWKLFLVFISVVFNSNANACEDFANKFLTDSRKNLSISQHRKYLANSIDTKHATKFSLGANWRTLSPEQRKEFYNIYSRYVIYKYAGQFVKYPVLSYNIIKTENDDRRKDICNITVLVKTIVNKQEKEIPLNAVVSTAENQFKIQDLIIENVSVLQMQNQEITSLIKSKGFNATLTTLEEFIKSQQ